MKLQIKYNVTDLTKALELAHQTEEFADIMEIGSLLIYKNGIAAVEAFSKAFPQKKLYIDAKITDQAEEAVRLYAQAGATYISVVAESYNSTIKTACATAGEYNVHIILDCMNAQSLGQSAMDAKPLGAYGILIHQITHTDSSNYPECELEDIRANTDLPIFIKGKINSDSIATIARLNPYAVILSDSITRAADPHTAAAYFHTLINP